MKIDIQFIKSVARDYDLQITDSEAREAHAAVVAHCGEQDYYYGLKDYFLN